MSYLKSLREDLGITQLVFSKILGIERGHFASIEAGIRTLPKTAQPILDWIERNLELFKVPEPAVVPEEKQIQWELRILRNDREKLLLILEKRMAKEKNLYQTGLFCKGIQAQYPAISEGLLKTVDSLGYNADLALETIRTEPILRLKARIKGIEAEIQTLEEGISAGPAA
jgi:transcriptional regulator with XRE-family HTH domain